MNKTEWNKKLKQQKEKAVSKCLNLQGKKEQLHLLIKQLQNLSYNKEYTFANWINNETRDQIDYLKPANLVINRELARAMKDQEALNKDIAELKSQIERLNNRIK